LHQAPGPSPKRANAQVLLHKRPARGIWGGLWTLPLFDDEQSLVQTLATLGPPWARPPQPLPAVQHALTHLDWTLHPWRVVFSGAQAPPAAPAVPAASAAGWVWMGLEDALGVGLPAPIRVLLEAEAAQAYCLGPRP
jgi:A/G-specific adenine glycosylase